MRHVIRHTARSIAICLALGIAALGAEESAPGPWSFHSELDLVWLQAGAEYRLGDAFGIQASVGASLISPLMTSYDLVGVWHARQRESALQLDIQAGLIQGYFNVLEPILDLDPTIDTSSVYWLPGVSASIGYRTRGGHVFSLCLGGGLLFGYDRYAWQEPSFFPKIALEYDFKP